MNLITYLIFRFRDNVARVVPVHSEQTFELAGILLNDYFLCLRRRKSGTKARTDGQRMREKFLKEENEREMKKYE